ncbi:MAG TPA: hypothetical protein VN947_19105 [Polyangia bacterium]|nr:hypothetical protein [Polyangia bacterium]
MISIASAGCGQGGTVDGPVGDAVARITSVPPMVGCVSITAAGSRSVTNNFNVTPGQSATLTIKNLPTGNVSFTAAAFSSACNAIAGTQANWFSGAPFVANISAGVVTSLMLTLEPTGGAVIGINFDTDGGTPLGDGGFPVGDGGLPGGDGGVFDLAPAPFDGGSGSTDLAHPVSDLAFPHD